MGGYRLLFMSVRQHKMYKNGYRRVDIGHEFISDEVTLCTFEHNGGSCRIHFHSVACTQRYKGRSMDPSIQSQIINHQSLTITPAQISVILNHGWCLIARTESTAISTYIGTYVWSHSFVKKQRENCNGTAENRGQTAAAIQFLRKYVRTKPQPNRGKPRPNWGGQTPAYVHT